MASLKDVAERQAFSLAIDAALKSLNKDREKALLNIVNLVEKYMGNNFRKESYEGVKKMIMNPDHKWMRYVNRLLDETDPHVAKMTALNLGYQAAFAVISWNAYEPDEKAKRRMGKITRRFLQDVQSGILHSPKYSLILVYNIMRGMGQHYAEGSRYPTADGTWWTDPCRNHSIYFPEVKIPFYKKWFGILFFCLGKWVGGMKKMEVTYRK